jgi:hypothetical protein
MLYLTIIIGGAILIAIANTLLSFSFELLLWNLLSVAIGVAAIIAQDGIGALIIRRLTPKKWFLPERRLFTVSAKERKFYTKVKIKKWKDHVPELGLFTGFSKSEIKEADDPEYLGRFLIESNYGVIIHVANAIFGFVIAFIPICSAPSIWIPIYAVNFVLSILPVAILRYTSHTLAKLYQRSKK